MSWYGPQVTCPCCSQTVGLGTDLRLSPHRRVDRRTSEECEGSGTTYRMPEPFIGRGPRVSAEEVRMLLRWRSAGAHMHVNVFVGPDRDHLVNAGQLVMRRDEAEAFRTTCLSPEVLEEGWVPAPGDPA